MDGKCFSGQTESGSQDRQEVDPKRIHKGQEVYLRMDGKCRVMRESGVVRS